MPRSASRFHAPYPDTEVSLRGGDRGRPRAGSVVMACVASLVAAACGAEGDGAAGADARHAEGSVVVPPESAPSFAFAEVAAESGLVMTITSGRTPATQIVEVKGGGLALIDRDGDGDLDVFVPNGATLDRPERGPGCRLFDNVGDPGVLAFVDATDDAGLAFDRWGVGVAVGDVDGNGFDDLYVTAFGANALLVNDGAGRFVDTSAEAGVGDTRWGTGCAFGDLDLDGDLDLYVTNYLAFDVDAPPPPSAFRGVPVFGGPFGLPAQADVLYANRGDGRFDDVSVASGIAEAPAAHGLNVLIIDMDGDGRQEIVVGNDSMANRLFDDAPDDAPDDLAGDAPGQVPGDVLDVGSSAGPETTAGAVPITDPGGRGAWTRRFVDRALGAGLATNAEGHEQATMGFALADVNADGLPDLYSTNFSSDSNTLHVSAPGGYYDDRTARFGLGAASRTSVGWATAFDDFDLDGDEDLVVFNGHVYSQASVATMDSPARQVPLLFEREGARFERVHGADDGWTDWLLEPHVDRSAAFGDLDGDGDTDMVVGERDGPLRLLRNDAGRSRGADVPAASLTVRLLDTRSGQGNTGGIGAVVDMRWDGGTARRWIHSGGSYLSASEQVARFGVPTAAVGKPLTVIVRWPDGHEQRQDIASPGDQLITRD